MKKFIWILFAILSACKASSAIELTEIDADKVISTSVGQEISITLTGNATTGYKWQFSSDKPVHSKVIKEVYVEERHPTGMVGVGGKSTYQIKVLRAGKFAITAQYYRPWETFDPKKDKHLKFIFEAF